MLFHNFTGCYKYTDGSNMFTISTEVLNDCKTSFSKCEYEKHISAPIEVTNQNCSIQWRKTAFRNDSRWDDLPKNFLGINPFQLQKENMKTIILKVRKYLVNSIKINNKIKVYR